MVYVLWDMLPVEPTEHTCAHLCVFRSHVYALTQTIFLCKSHLVQDILYDET